MDKFSLERSLRNTVDHGSKLLVDEKLLKSRYCIYGRVSYSWGPLQMHHLYVRTSTDLPLHAFADEN